MLVFSSCFVFLIAFGCARPRQLRRSVASVPNNTPIAVWILAFMGSCVGLGFAAGYVARRRGQSASVRLR